MAKMGMIPFIIEVLCLAGQWPVLCIILPGLVSRKEQQGCSKAKLGLGWLRLKKGSLRGHGNSVQSTLKTLIAEVKGVHFHLYL